MRTSRILTIWAIRCWASLTLISTGCAAMAQSNLADYLHAHPWNPEISGSLLILEPERARSNGPATSWGSFSRKLATVGALKTIVPNTMIVIDDTLADEPNVYEGLPAQAKVLYLLRSLSSDQWRKASGDGIGLGDLMGEQKLVFQSLLPNPFSWSSYKVAANGFFGPEGPKGTLTDDDRLRVRIKVERAIDLRVFLQNPPNSSSNYGTEDYHGRPGSLQYQRDMQRDFVQTSAYGLQIRKEADNKPKPSQLDTRGVGFSKPIRVDRNTTVGAILKAVGLVASTEIIADFRVADRSVEFFGGSATARDLLTSLALSVEGTYRKVGAAYVLTSDLEGMGTRKLRLAQWEETLRRETDRRKEQWEHEIGDSGRLSQVKYDPDSPLAPNDNLSQQIEKHDQTGAWDTTPASELTPALREYLNTWDQEYRQQPIMKDKVGVSSKIVYRYVMPNGTPLQPEGELAPTRSFVHRNQPFKDPDVPSGPFAIPASLKPAFMFEANDSEAASEAVRLASSFPGSCLWIVTRTSEALSAALQTGKTAGVEIGLAIRPWRWPGQEKDRNLEGDSGPSIADRETARFGTAPYGKVEFQGRIGLWMSPMDAAVSEAWRTYAALAATPGLAGTMLLETQPFGYEAKRERWQSAVGPLDWAIISHGYTTNQRLEFLRLDGVDPVDIGDDGYWTTPDLRQPYFFDDGLRGMLSMYDGTDDTNPKTRRLGEQWRQMLANANKSAMLNLIQATKPSYIEPRLENINSLEGQPVEAYPFDPLIPLSTVNPRQARSAAYSGAYMFIPIWEDPAAPLARMSTFILSAISKQLPQLKDRMPLIDLTNVPRAKWEATLRHWVKLGATS